LTGLWDVDAGGSHNCAVYMNTELRCWGLGSSIQLGNGSAASRSRPVPVSDLTDTGALTGAASPGLGRAHSCARYADGVVCWGDNASGQIGDGTTTVHNVPVVVQA
jgi:alpha-tubulin suppressor-like RCC1 family protein